VVLVVVVLLSLVAVLVHGAEQPKYTPVVLMHGITDDKETTYHVRDLLQAKLPGIYVLPVEIGNGKIDSLFESIDSQVAQFCDILASEPNLTDGVNAIGFSQGGLIVRGYLERCNKPPVKNLVAWVSPQMGVYGVPVVGHISYVNVTLDAIADCCIYDWWAQDLLAFAGYWRDPFALDTYRAKCTFLPDINNDRTNNSIYKQRMLSLQNFIMSYSLIDDVLIPRETGWFGTYAPNSDEVIIPLEKSALYLEDRIGLR
jgi:palmitoyl-protein thioesterase